MYGCKSRPTGLFTTTTTCAFTISPLESAGHTHFHAEKAFGSNSAYTDVVEVKGRLSVMRGEATLAIVDEERTTHTVTAAANSPAPFEFRMKTTWRSTIRGLEFMLKPGGATRSADSLRLEYEFTR
jgi:hypothetical protein